MTSIYNAYNRELYELEEKELKNIQEGEIPLKKQPSKNCKKCYGRGYLGYIELHHMYKPCINCIEKNVLQGYEKTLNFNYIKFKNR